jgi:3',5'-cyclic AMP phosphodiesterase CpdA
MFILGDFAYLWGRKEDYELARRLLQPVVDAGIGVTIGMGNHDRRENFLERWPEYADRSPVPGRIVSKVHGVHFDYIMADTLDQPVETDRWITPGTLDDAQREWLTKDLEANKDAKWKIMLFHEPVYHRLGGGESKPWLHDVIESYGVDLVIQGHSHLVTRTYPMKDGKIVTKAVDGTIEKGIGTVYTTIGSTALNHDGANDAKYEEEISVLATPTPTQPAYTTITVKDDRIVVTTKQVNGYVLDSFTIVDKGNSGNTSGDPSGDQSTETPDNSEDASEDASEDVSEDVSEEISEDISEEISDGVSVDTSADASEAVSKEDSDVSEDESKTDVSESASEGSDSDEEEESGSATVIITVSAIAAVIVAAVVLILLKRKKK